MRYAIYFAGPTGDPFMDLGNQWLGRNVFSGAPLVQPTVSDVLPTRLAELTADPRRYGFHGTLKAPFALANDKTEADLVAACQVFAGSVAPFETTGLHVSKPGKFLALTPIGEDEELQSFAGLCVRTFEQFRAPLPANDLARRRQSGLSHRQDRHLVAWGYPYIFDEFRFHMTLTGKLQDSDEADALERAAKIHFSEVVGLRRTCSTVGLYVEPEHGAPFQVHTIFDLTGTVPPAQLAVRSEEVQ